jgi:hypothetical protein
MSAPITPLITTPGAYDDIPAEDYHGNANLLPAPSLSSSGAKLLIQQSPLHFWWNSPLNPDREEDEKPHFKIGRMAHDFLLLPERIEDSYFILPEGFSASATKKFADVIEARDLAIKAGKTVLTHKEHQTVLGVANAIGMDQTARLAMSAGRSEVTIAWQDKETGVWLRCRPDWLPDSVVRGGDIRAVTDLKFMAPTHCSPQGFARALHQFGYHLSAGFYSTGIEAVFGYAPTHWLHLVIEKEPPYSVSSYVLPQDDIDRGKAQMKIAIRKFADCLMAGKWPGYTEEPINVGLGGFDRKIIDQFGTRQDEALFNSAQD